MKVFISYSRKDLAFVDELVTALRSFFETEQIGEVFYDVDLLPGEEWPKRLRKELEDADFVLSILSPDFLTSKGAKTELAVVRERELLGVGYMVPVLSKSIDYNTLDHFLPKDEAAFLQSKQYVDFTSDFTEGLGELLSLFKKGVSRVFSKMKDTPPLALVMKGGGVKGLAYVGAIEELERYYKFNWFIGTSAGAIAAVLLGTGYTTNELRKVLVDKDFRDFLDSSVFKLPFNLIFKGGLYEGRSFTVWLDKCIGAKVRSFAPLPVAKLPNRVTVYASRRYKRALIFDTDGPKEDTAASFAARCSMSIPFVFTPQRDQGLRVLDGGMQNNYPVGDLWANNPEAKFIGLYLGNYYEGMPKEPGLLKEMLSIWTEAVDVEALERYGKDTVVIDPRPIKTTNFKLSAKEKEFLLKVGKASALRFLLERDLPYGPTAEYVEKAENEAQQAKVAVEGIRSRRRTHKLLFLIVFIITSGVIVWLWPRRPDDEFNEIRPLNVNSPVQTTAIYPPTTSASASPSTTTQSPSLSPEIKHAKPGQNPQTKASADERSGSKADTGIKGSPTPSADERARLLIRAGESSMGAGNYDDAMRKFDEALRIAGISKEVRNELRSLRLRVVTLRPQNQK